MLDFQLLLTATNEIHAATKHIAFSKYLRFGLQPIFIIFCRITNQNNTDLRGCAFINIIYFASSSTHFIVKIKEHTRCGCETGCQAKVVYREYPYGKTQIKWMNNCFTCYNQPQILHFLICPHQSSFHYYNRFDRRWRVGTWLAPRSALIQLFAIHPQQARTLETNTLIGWGYGDDIFDIILKYDFLKL